MSYLKQSGLTKGIVVDVEDPAGFNRIKVRIPELHGAVSEQVYSNCGPNAAQLYRVDDSSLPWCEVCYPYGNNTQPSPNQVVLVGFINGSTSQPVVLGWLGYDYTDEEDILVVKTTRNR